MFIFYTQIEIKSMFSAKFLELRMYCFNVLRPELICNPMTYIKKLEIYSQTVIVNLFLSLELFNKKVVTIATHMSE